VIKILCVDDSADLTRLICIAVSRESDMDVVGELHSATGLLEEIHSKQPDVVVLDMGIPGVDVTDLLRKVSKARLSSRFVMYSGYDDRETVDSALDAGASGYVSKGEGLDTLFATIRKVAHGAAVA
jgi:DNA-binding NarL/FixJ family response regulator